MKKIIRFIPIVFIISIIVVIGLIFVSKNNQNNQNKKNNENVVEKNNDKKDDSKKEEKKVKIVNLDSKTRPYAVMINCHSAALPQSGLQDAYIVYEIMVEAGITRMMAVFKDVDINKVGSIRSLRNQYK